MDSFYRMIQCSEFDCLQSKYTASLLTADSMPINRVMKKGGRQNLGTRRSSVLNFRPMPIISTMIVVAGASCISGRA